MGLDLRWGWGLKAVDLKGCVSGHTQIVMFNRARGMLNKRPEFRPYDIQEAWFRPDLGHMIYRKPEVRPYEIQEA